MKPLVYIISLSIIMWLSFGFITSEKKIKFSKLQTASSQQLITGQELFQNNCASCHGKDLKGNPPNFPSLINIGSRMTKSEVEKVLKNGRNGMPSFSYLPTNQRNAIIDFLFGKSSSTENIDEKNPIALGQSLFTANCAKCHQLKKDDPIPPGRRNWGPTPAILGGINSYMNFSRFNKILTWGPAYMPSFSNLNIKQKEAIYKYLSTFKNDSNFRRHGMRCGCGMKNMPYQKYE